MRSKIETRTRLCVRALVVLLGVCGGAASMWGALWESPTWALQGNGEARVTYDSNIYGTAVGEGDTIGQLTPTLWLERRASSLEFEVRGGADFRWFDKNPDENTTNPFASLTLVFPSSDISLPTQELNLQYTRSRDPDLDVGRRLWRTFYGGDWTGKIFDTGKTRLRALVDMNRTEFEDGADSSVTDYGRVGVQLSYRPDPLLELGGGASYSTQDYNSSAPNDPTLTRDGVDMFVSARGEFSAKLSGRIAGGLTHASYGGGVTGGDWDWIARGNLTWQPDDRRRVNLTLSRRPSFSSDGQLSVYSNANVSFYQSMSGGFDLVVRTGLGFVSREETPADDYNFITAGTSLRYNFTGKLEAEVGADQRWYNSDVPSRDFNRYTIYGSCGYRF